MDAGILLEFRQSLAVCLPYGAAKGDVRNTSAAFHLDQASFGELLQVVRNCRGSNDRMGLQRAARQVLRLRDLLQDGEATRIGDGSPNRLELVVCELELAGDCAHVNKRRSEGAD